MGQAKVLTELIHLHDVDPDLFIHKLQSGAVWGSSGSVWEVGELGCDHAEFWDLFIALSEQMDANGIACEGSRFIGQMLRAWRTAGL
jgi:hypothetical protein